MKKAFLFTLIFSFLILKGYSQYEVKIVYHNNNIEEGYADLIDGNSEFVKFKKSKTESFSKIESEKISSITYYNAGFSYTFHYIGIRFLTPITKTKYKEKHWAWLKKESSIINCYFAGDYYKLKKDGDITIIDDFKATGYFLIRKNEQFATYYCKK